MHDAGVCDRLVSIIRRGHVSHTHRPRFHEFMPDDRTELVDRLNRIQTNTVQNTVPFLMILMMWWLSEVSTAWSTYWMTAFTALRTLYSVCLSHCLGPPLQRWVALRCVALRCDALRCARL